MAWKVITFLAIFALSEARPPTSEQRVKIENFHSPKGSHEPEYQAVYASAYPFYEFTYEVSDPHTHDFKGHHEQRKGDDVKGYYWLIQPDGLKRTVKYNVDKHSGFKANVEYTKHWEEENEMKKEEGESNEEENNSSENDNSEGNGNGQENENNGNENEGREETENNESNEGEENREEQGEAEETENQEGEQSELREEHWRGQNNIGRGNNGRRERGHGHELKATVGIWQPNHWGRRHRNEELRLIRSNEGKENNGENEKRRGDTRGNKGRNEERRKETDKNETSERKDEKKEEKREGNENAESHIESNHKGKVLKTEYHVVIHHPKHST